ASSAARGGRRCGDTARSRTRPRPGESAPKSPRASPSPLSAEHTSVVADLFSDAVSARLPEVAPLALRMRPQSLDDFVGQQHALLPAVEEGLVTLIGATTENPYFEVNSALLSRAQVYELEPLSHDDLVTIAARGAQELGATVPADLLDLIAQRAGGDARSA